MIEKTVFENNEEIILYVKEIYGLDIHNVRKIDRESANIYSLNDNKQILKEFQSKYSKVEIDKEIEVINHLRKFDIKVPKYVRTLNNRYDDVYKNKTIIIKQLVL